MTTGTDPHDHRVLDTWRAPEFASAWAERDVLGNLLALPRSMAAALVAADRPDAAVVVDVGSGPGSFLAAFLDRMPAVRGVWTDGSEAMQSRAQEQLASYGDRVEYRLVDMTALATAGLPRGVDAMISSRALHHLSPEALREYYAAAAQLLAPGGWLVELDHMGHGDPWQDRLRVLRSELLPRTDPAPSHLHPHPQPTLEQHVEAMAAAGVTDIAVVWKSFATCLVVGRAPGPAHSSA